MLAAWLWRRSKARHATSPELHARFHETVRACWLLFHLSRSTCFGLFGGSGWVFVLPESPKRSRIRRLHSSVGTFKFLQLRPHEQNWPCVHASQNSWKCKCVTVSFLHGDSQVAT